MLKINRSIFFVCNNEYVEKISKHVGQINTEREKQGTKNIAKQKIDQHESNLDTEGSTISNKLQQYVDNQGGESDFSFSKQPERKTFDRSNTEEIKRTQEQTLDSETDEGSFLHAPRRNPIQTTNEIDKIPAKNILFDLDESKKLQQKLFEYSKELVYEGEKNVKLAQSLEESRDKISFLNETIESARSEMLRGIDGVDILDLSAYSHVSLVDLLRLRLQSMPLEDIESNEITRTKKLRKKRPKKHIFPAGMENLPNSTSGKEYQPQNESEKPKHIKMDSDLEGLKKKIRRLVERSRQERDSRTKLEKELLLANERVEVLSDHIEKLMVHLKHEALAKARSLSENSKAQKEIDLLKTRNQTMVKRNGRKEKAINDLKEGGKILEDQLRLMDEKYMELRMKLDWTRIQTERIIKRKEEEVRQLRAKFVLINDMANKNTKVRNKLSYWWSVLANLSQLM